MTALDRMDEWDNERFFFLLGEIHGETILRRGELTTKTDPGPRWFYCKEHASWEGPLHRVSGIKAYAWAKARSA